MRAYYHALENTLQKPHNKQALTARTIITTRTKYGALPDPLNILDASKVAPLIALTPLS